MDIKGSDILSLSNMELHALILTCVCFKGLFELKGSANCTFKEVFKKHSSTVTQTFIIMS